MTVAKIYKNFFLRNIIINTFVYLVIVACVYDEIKLEGTDWIYITSKVKLDIFRVLYQFSL